MNIRIILTLSIIVIILTQVDYELLGHEISNINLHLFLLSACAIAAQIFFLNIRWHLLINAGRQKLDFKTSSMINVAGIFANTIFISSIGGMVAKPALSIRYGISVLHSLFATLLDRFLTFIALIVLSVFAVPFLSDILHQDLFSVIAMCALLCGLIGGSFLILLHSGGFKSLFLTSNKRMRLLASLKNLTQNKRTLSLICFSSIASQCFFIVAVLLLAQGYEFEGNPFAFAAILPVLALISSLPISVGGWGVREGAFIYGLGLIGFAKESALLLAIQVGVVTLLTPMIIGFFLILISSEFQKIVLRRPAIKKG